MDSSEEEEEVDDESDLNGWNLLAQLAIFPLNRFKQSQRNSRIMSTFNFSWIQ